MIPALFPILIFYLKFIRATSSVEVFLDAADISREDFVKHATFLDKVHRMFTTHNFVAPGQNQRPTLRHIRLSKECRQKILNIFFDDDGSLKNDIVGDIDFSTENDPRYIDFGNTAENGRKDRRYQIGLKKQIFGKLRKNNSNLSQPVIWQ
jgi:hypothetical protein